MTVIESSPHVPHNGAAMLVDPVVVRLDPSAGWAQADWPRRVFALAALPLTLVLAVLLSAGVFDSGDLYLIPFCTTVLLGPPAYYSLARVLRPHPRQLERTSRHLLASTATSFATLPLVENEAGDGLVMAFALGLPAFGLGVLTLAWGATAGVVRIARRHASP